MFSVRHGSKVEYVESRVLHPVLESGARLMIFTQNGLIIFGVVVGGLGFVIGWFGAWIAGAFKTLTEEERRMYRRMK